MAGEGLRRKTWISSRNSLRMTQDEQEELARRIESSMAGAAGKSPEGEEPGEDSAYPSAQFKREVDKLKKEREQEKVARGRKRKTYAESLEKMCMAYLKMLTEAKSKDEKALARRMAEDTQKEIEKIFEAQD